MSTASLDGNAAAGDLSDIFAVDVTTAMVTCASCRQTHAMATMRAYLRAPGMVLRCASCDAPQVRFVRASGRAWLDLRGIELLEVRLSSETDELQA